MLRIIVVEHVFGALSKIFNNPKILSMAKAIDKKGKVIGESTPITKPKYKGISEAEKEKTRERMLALAKESINNLLNTYPCKGDVLGFTVSIEID